MTVPSPLSRTSASWPAREDGADGGGRHHDRGRAGGPGEGLRATSPATTFLEIYSKPLMTAGSDTFIDDMITIAGGENIGAQAGSGFPNFSTEVLVKDDPQVYIADSGSMSAPGDINKRAGFCEPHRRQRRQGLRDRGQHHRAARPASRRGAPEAGRDDPSGGFRALNDEARPHRRVAGDPPGRRHVRRLPRAGARPGPGLAVPGPALASVARGAGTGRPRQRHLLADPHAARPRRFPRRRGAGGRRRDPPGPVPQPVDGPVRDRRLVGRRARRHHRHRPALRQPAVDDRAGHRRRARHAGHRLDGGAPARPHRHLRAPARRRHHLVPRQRPRHRADDQSQPGHDGDHLLAHGQLLRTGLGRRPRRPGDDPVHGPAAVLHAGDGHPAAGGEACARARRGSRAHQAHAAGDGRGAHRAGRLGERHHRLRRPGRAAHRAAADGTGTPRAAPGLPAGRRLDDGDRRPALAAR